MLSNIQFTFQVRKNTIKGCKYQIKKNTLEFLLGYK